MEISKAINRLAPTAKFAVTNEDINQIEWRSEDIEQPSNEAILAEAEVIKAEYDALEWKRNRQAEYPDAIECVHALLDGGDTLTDLQAQRTAIKDKYPKS